MLIDGTVLRDDIMLYDILMMDVIVLIDGVMSVCPHSLWKIRFAFKCCVCCSETCIINLA